MTRLHPLARILLPVWAVVLVGALTHPLFAPGALALRDMLVLARPALSPAALGVGDLPARNAPQDGVLALVGTLVDASWFARLLILAGAAVGVVGAGWLALLLRPGTQRVSTWPVAAAMTIAVYNPFAVERLLQGHWSLVIAAWLMPLIAAAGLASRPLIAAAGVFTCSLTPTGAVLATLVAVICTRSLQARAGLGVWGLAVSLPWLIPGFLHSEAGTSLAHSVTAFAPRAEQFVGTAGSLVGLGGIWNAQAVPDSREMGFALFGVVLFALLLTASRLCPLRLLILAALGLGTALCAWLVPELIGLVVSHVPGGGLIRDSQKLVMLALPAYVALAASLDKIPAVAALILALLQVPDAPLALAELRPVTITIDEEIVTRADGRDVLFLDRGPLTYRADGTVIIEPHTKAVSVVESGELVVDGLPTDQPTRRYTAAAEAFAAGDFDKLERLGVGIVVTPTHEIVEVGEAPRDRRGGIMLLAWWLALGATLTASAVVRQRRQARQRQRG